MIKKRASNIELLRIILMIMIVLWHLLGHGLGLLAPDYYENTDKGVAVFPLLIMPFLCYHVNTFFFLSGYYGIRTKPDRLLAYLFQLAFYGIITYLSFILVKSGMGGLSGIRRCDIWNLFPFVNDLWWYATQYLLLMVFAPLLNEGMERVSPKMRVLTVMVLLLFFVSGFRFYESYGYDLFIYVVSIYLLGRLFMLNGISMSFPVSVMVYSASVMCIVCMLLYEVFMKGCSYWHIMHVLDYTNPFCIMAAVSFFFIFRNLTVAYSKYVNFTAKGVFAVYLVTDGYLREWFVNNICGITDKVCWLLPVSVIVVVIVSLSDYVRRWLGDICLSHIQALVQKALSVVFRENVVRK